MPEQNHTQEYERYYERGSTQLHILQSTMVSTSFKALLVLPTKHLPVEGEYRKTLTS